VICNFKQISSYAETPPDLDVDGIDTAHKVSLLAGNSFRFMPSFDSVFVEGIRSITTDDIHIFGKLGYKIKLLG
jgi:homoserine dehydrogenase